MREPELAALADLFSRVGFGEASEAFAKFEARYPRVPRIVLLAHVLCRACAAGSTAGVIHALRLGAPLTYHALVAADDGQRAEVCDMLLRFKVQIPRRFVPLLSAATQAKLFAAIHIVD